MSDDLISGALVITRRLDYMSMKGQRSIAASMIRAGLNVTAKQIRKDTDTKAKDARKTVKGRFKKGRKQFVLDAKVGFRVGKKAHAKVLRPRKAGKGGVGISGQNIHWWVAGTKGRKTQRNADRGRMPAMQPGLARIAYAKSAGNIKAEMIKRGALQLKKEIVKLQRIN